MVYTIEYYKSVYKQLEDVPTKERNKLFKKLEEIFDDHE